MEEFCKPKRPFVLGPSIMSFSTFGYEECTVPVSQALSSKKNISNNVRPHIPVFQFSHFRFPYIKLFYCLQFKLRNRHIINLRCI
jgi:hypothetical protein